MIREWRGNRRGASTRNARRRAARVRIPVRALIGVLLGVIGIAAVGGVGYGAWHAVQAVAAVPVARVVFSGELQYVGRDELVAQVQPQLAQTGFFTADLEALRAAVEELPWVDRVAIVRHWPDELEMIVSEQQPIARWGDDGLLNHHGEVFRPQQLAHVEQLPHLKGPDAAAAEVVEQYGRLATLLAELPLELIALEVDERGSWIAILTGGVKLNLGGERVIQRAERFMQVYRAELAGRFEEVSYVDLRYANGLAVGWKAAAEQRS